MVPSRKVAFSTVCSPEFSEEKSFNIAFLITRFLGFARNDGQKKICKLYENEFIKLADDCFVRTQTKVLDKIATSAAYSRQAMTELAMERKP